MWVANSGSSPEDRDHFLGLHLRAMGPMRGTLADRQSRSSSAAWVIRCVRMAGPSAHSQPLQQWILLGDHSDHEEAL